MTGTFAAVVTTTYGRPQHVALGSLTSVGRAELARRGTGGYRTARTGAEALTRTCRDFTQTYRVLRRVVSEAQRQRSAVQAGRRMIARGERPEYRFQATPDGRSAAMGAPWLSVPMTDRREALEAARSMIATWLESDPETFEVALD